MPPVNWTNMPILNFAKSARRHPDVSWAYPVQNQILTVAAMRSSEKRYKITAELAIVFIALILGGCASPPIQPGAADSANKALFPPSVKQSNTQKKLARHYRSWQKTPYKVGGLSKNGIDCSGFVHVTYRDVFTTQVPRSTELLAKTGKSVSATNLKLGDLVFFKTGVSQRHVGIYVGKRKFIHASSSQGVMQSSIDSPYWSQAYWQSKRILN